MATRHDERGTDVVVVGAGPVGLVAAIDLATRGVRVVLVDEHTAPPPGAWTSLFDAATMAQLDRWGVADVLRRAAEVPEGWSDAVTVTTAVAARPLARMPLASAGADGHLRIPQNVALRILLDHAAALPGVEVLLGWRAVAVSDDRRGVSLDVEPVAGAAVGAAPLHLRTAWAVGCDGAWSLVRRAAGGRYVGPGVLGRQLGIEFRSRELARVAAGGPSVGYLVTGAVAGVLGALGDDHWWFSLGDLPADAAAPDPVAVVRAAAGADVDVTILSAEVWPLQERIVDRFGAGHLVLAGDAAHLAPPHGGHNLNAGIADALALGPRLAAAVHDRASASVLDGYDDERRPAAVAAARAAGAQADQLAAARRTARHLLASASTEGELAAAGRAIAEVAGTAWASATAPAPAG